MEETKPQEKMMGEVQTFHLGSNFVPQMIANFLEGLPWIPDPGDRALKIDDFVSRLQEELRKIYGFKSELPLCVILMNEAIESLKEESNRINSSRAGEPILAEFIPLSRCSEEGQKVKTRKEADPKDKKNWMSSVQLWNADHHQIQSSAQIPLFELQCKEGNGTVALKKESKQQLREEQLSSGSGSSLVPFVRMVSCERSISGPARVASPNLQSARGQQQQLLRKKRRCWAPELHRQFVNALEKLGGPKVATPKQIRELMNVDGLTNDEVKSHLQKYRLHTRRLPNVKDTYPSNVLAIPGDLWMNKEDKYRESSGVSDSRSGSPHGPLQLANNKSRTSLTGGDSIEEDDGNERQS